MEILVKAAQLILSLSILVFVHEMGHFFFARLFKTRVEKFYLFFNPWFSLFKKKIGETEYGIGWLPLGGYVKISGMIDESMDKEQMQQPPQPYEFRSKKSWQRLLIMLGGIMVNVVFAFIFYSIILFSWGEEYLPNKEAKYGIMVSQTGKDMGLMSGDKILTVDGKEIENFRKISHDIIVNKAEYIEVERNGERLKVMVPDSIWARLLQDPIFISERIPFYVAEFDKESAGKDAGMLLADQIVGFNKYPVTFFDEIKDSLSNSKGKKVIITVLRDKDSIDFAIKVPETGRLGIRPDGELSKFFTTKKIEYGFFESFPAGVRKTISTLDSYVKQFKLLFSPETKAYENMGGFIKIGSLFPGEWDWYAFWNMTALLSIILAFMNLLPIPALDGGHVLFLLYEMITGRKPSDKFLEYAQIAGMVIIFGLLIWANGNDIIGLFK